MIKKTIFLFLIVLVSFGVARKVFAYDLVLTKVGTLSTAGVDYSVVSYSGTSIPALEGTATPSSQVGVKVGLVQGYTTAASGSGAWTFVPTALDTGSNTITLTSGIQTISFSLIYNASSSGTPTATPTPTPIDELPATGVGDKYIIFSILGVAVLFLGGYIKRRMNRWEGK